MYSQVKAKSDKQEWMYKRQLISFASLKLCYCHIDTIELKFVEFAREIDKVG